MGSVEDSRKLNIKKGSNAKRAAHQQQTEGPSVCVNYPPAPGLFIFLHLPSCLSLIPAGLFQPVLLWDYKLASNPHLICTDWHRRFNPSGLDRSITTQWTHIAGLSDPCIIYCCLYISVKSALVEIPEDGGSKWCLV